MSFQYLKSIDYELLPSSWQNKEAVLSLNENNQEHVCSKEQKAAEQETSAEGLILKELPSHLKYAFLEPEKGKPVIISAALTEIEEQKLLQILRKYKEAIAEMVDCRFYICNIRQLRGSPVHVVPKKGGFTLIINEENELIPKRIVTRWRVCIDYRKLNTATRKDHFPLPFID